MINQMKQDMLQSIAMQPKSFSHSGRLGLSFFVLLLCFFTGVRLYADDVLDNGFYYLQNKQDNNQYYLVPAVGYDYHNDSATPYLTTFQTQKDKNSIWQVVKVEVGGETYYRFIHAATGKYLTANEAVANTGGTPNARQRLHLEAFDTPGEATLFVVVKHTSASNNQIAIRSKSYYSDDSSQYWWFDIADGNQNSYSTGNYKGTLGFWRVLSASNDAAKWLAEAAPAVCTTPLIVFDEAAMTATITCRTDGVTIHYTTDGTEPTESAPTFSSTSPIELTDNAVNTIRAIAVRDGYESSLIATRSILLGTAYTTGYYALHCNGTGYLKVNSGDATLTGNDGTFRNDNPINIFSNGNSIWVITEEGYLQNEYYYLNVLNNRTLYLDVTPHTRWLQEDVAGSTKKHLYINDGTQNKYLCYEGSAVAVSANPTKYYSACPITITEKSWSGPSSDKLTLRSPQSVTYLRHYFTQNATIEFNNDAEAKVSNTQNRRIYATLAYVSGGDGKGTTWDITDEGIIYNKQTSGDVSVTATYNVLPADLIARSKHADPVPTSITFTLQPPLFTPDATKNYLMFYINNENYQFPYDESLAEGDPVASDGKNSMLTEANPAISWKIERDESGFCMFKNVRSGRYLYFDADDLSHNDYGEVKMGATTLPTDGTETQYKFFLYSLGNDGTFGACYSIIPYEKQFVVFKNDGRTNNIMSALGADTGQSILSLYKPGEQKWRFYAYEWEHNITSDWEVNGPLQAYTTGDYVFKTSSTVFYSYKVKGSPTNNFRLAQTGTKSKVPVSFTMTYTPTNTSTGNSYTITDNSNGGDGSFTLTFSEIKAFTSGKVKLTAKVDAAHGNKSFGKEFTFNVLMQNSEPEEFTMIASLSDITDPAGNYKLKDDITDGSKPGVDEFTGYLDGNFHTISSLSAPLFTTLTGAAVVRNLNLSGVSISGSGNKGAVACNAVGSARIYNVGILDGTLSSTAGSCGGVVGLLDDMARVINCFSYANITGGTTVGGIVGYNNCATTQTDPRTMVMNCMMYGDITDGGTDAYPVYGGKKITNKGQNVGVNNYNFYREASDITVADDHYYCSWPVEEEYLTRFDYVRSVLNSNRELCAWWITGNVSDTALVAKWVYAPQEAKHPILKHWGRYPSMINRDIDGKSLYPREGANDYEGKDFGTLKVTVQSGKEIADKSIQRLITDMDTLHYDYGYYKIQLPYYNDVFGNPTSNDHATRYGGNYTDKVVVGWEVVSVTGGTPGTFSTDDASGYNFADRNCTQKDIYDVSGRVFAQGGYYYVPEGVTQVTIKAHWAKAYYCANTDYYRDCVDFNPADGTNGLISYAFTPAGTVASTFHGQSVYAGLVAAQNAIKTTGGTTVYDNAIVLVGNVQHRNGNTNNLYISGKTKGFTIMSVDLDFDDEPDYVLPLQTGQKSDKPNINPIRFDFVQAPDMGMVLKRDGDKNRLAVSCIYMSGHFEITETSALHFNELYFGNNDTNKDLAPIIFNGGQTLEFVAGEKDKTQDRTQYIIAGGNAHMRSLYQGNHNNKTYKIKHAPMSVMGGEFDECYLSGNIRSMASSAVYSDSPRLYTNGGRFAIIAGAGQEAVNGSVYFQIDHSIIDEFYGGSTSENGQVTGDINVQIDHSLVGKYCGGPMVGNMTAGKSITTSATGTTFGQFFGAGNGGTSFSKIEDLSADLWKLDGKDGFAHAAIDNDWKLLANYSPMRWNYKSNNSYEARYHFEIWPLPSGTAAVCAARRYVYGAQFAATKTGNVTSTLKDCTLKGDFYGGGNLGAVEGDVTSTLIDCKVKGSVFGAGYSAAVPSFECYLLENLSYPWQDTNTSICHDYVVGATKRYTWTNDGETGKTYDNRDGDGINYVHTDYPLTGLGNVSGKVTLTISGTTTVAGDVYGGGALASMDGDTEVQLLGGTIVGNAYGGAKGSTNVAALVGGDVKVLLNGTDPADNTTWVPLDKKGCVVEGSIFGGNNINGTPKGDIEVHIMGTQNAATATIGSKSFDEDNTTIKSYDVAAVYGGGNQAAYDPNPKDTDTEGENTRETKVVVYECERSAISMVYGGGNAAPVPATHVTINGGWFDYIFGGGNGAGEGNPGANVGFRDYSEVEDTYDTKEKRETDADFLRDYVYGSGQASVNIHGGLIRHVFGGSNTKGNVRKVAVTMLEDAEGCDFCVDEAYGGGKSAPMDAEARLLMSCIPGLKAVYGGSEAADIEGDVTLNITNGTFERVFGGNNISGTIRGSITVNIEETGCKPIVIGELYGGGNRAAYSVYGYRSETDAQGKTISVPLKAGDEGALSDATKYAHPLVNVKSFSSIGTIYGGGYGETAVMVGDPEVNINEVLSGNDDDVTAGSFSITDKNEDGTETAHTANYPAHTKGKMGTIGSVFGGGNAAEVVGSPCVNIGTKTGEMVDILSLPVLQEGNPVYEKDANNQDVYEKDADGRTTTRRKQKYQQQEVKGADIKGNIYGGGNNARVTGDAAVQIGK